MDDSAVRRVASALRWLQQHAPIDVLLACPVCESVDASVRAPSSPGVPGAASPPMAAVLAESPSAALPAWLVVDLAIAGGGRVALAPCPCLDRSAMARLAPLTEGRVVIGLDDRAPTARLDLAHPPVSRRALLRPLSAPVEHRETDDDARLLESLRALGVVDADRDAPARRLSAAGCVACGVCAHACPTGALDLTVTDGRATLAQRVDRCQGDLACVRLCPESVMVDAGPLDWGAMLAAERRTLASLAVGECARCRTRVPAGQRHCEACRRRLADPFGMHVPADVARRLPEEWQRKLR